MSTEHTTKNSITLNTVKEGQHATILAFTSGKEHQRRLLGMGLTVGTRIKVIRNSSMGGPLLIGFHHSRFMIGRGMAKDIVVKTRTNKQHHDS